MPHQFKNLTPRHALGYNNAHHSKQLKGQQESYKKDRAA